MSMTPREQHAATLTNMKNAIAASSLRVCLCCGDTYRKDTSTDHSVCPTCRDEDRDQCCSNPEVHTISRKEARDGTEFVKMRCGNCGRQWDIEA